MTPCKSHYTPAKKRARGNGQTPTGPVEVGQSEVTDFPEL